MHEIERFKARSDDGKYETTVVIYQQMIPAGTRENPRAMISGMKEARTIDDDACTPKDDTGDLWGIVAQGIIVRRVRSAGTAPVKPKPALR